jgi:CheY-like chemotaxis protein
VADSGTKACELIDEKGMYDVYFIDWYMPEINGIELARRIRKYSGAEQSVCIMISAQEMRNIEAEARLAGVDSFLQKPIYPSAIVDCLNNYVSIVGGIDKKHVMLVSIFAGKRILLAEDVKINREIVKAQLAITKIEIDCAEDGKEAVKMFSENPQKYEMIFMDMQMPEMDGLEATRAIRALEIPEARIIPIVAMTANVFREDIENCLEAGMNDHIGKPLDISIVIAKIRQYIGKGIRNDGVFVPHSSEAKT